MINTTDLQEVEVLLPGDWRREDNGDIYSFTANKMELKDDRLYKQLIVRHGESKETYEWALAIKDDYCAINLGQEEFLVQEIGHEKDGSAHMVWSSEDGQALIRFNRGV